MLAGPRARRPMDIPGRGGGLKLQRIKLGSGELSPPPPGWRDGVAIAHAHLPSGEATAVEVLRASAGRTVGRPEPGEDVVTFFELAEDATLQPAGDKAVAPAADGTGGTGGTTYVCDLDDSGRPTLELVTRSAAADTRAGGPPGGMLLLLLHPSDDARNAAVLAPLAEARAAVAARCWGLTVLRPSSCWSAC